MTEEQFRLQVLGRLAKIEARVEAATVAEQLLGQIKAEVERQDRIGEIMATAGVPDPPPERARRRENRHLRVVE